MQTMDKLRAENGMTTTTASHHAGKESSQGANSSECRGDVGCHSHHMHLQSAYQDQPLGCSQCQQVFSVERYLQDHEHFDQHQPSEVEDIFPFS
jgi:protein-arginine kinase activator protein McsA